MFLKILNAIKNIGLSSILILGLAMAGIIFVILVLQTTKQTYAFPSAEGYGAFAKGGRGGVVYHVRTLEDNYNVGSLRYAIEQKGPRTIVFDVSGIIELKSPLVIKNNDLTIAGQTAPGDGICIKNHPVIINADNVIVRFIRFRLGDRLDESNALVVKNRHDVIIDHCSISWATAENIKIYNNQKLTMQWCIISEALDINQLKSNGAILGGYSASYHHNLFANNLRSNPKFYSTDIKKNLELENVDFRNNVLYNWGFNSVEGASTGTYNIVNNYYKFGPATKMSTQSQILKMDKMRKPAIIYVSGNYIHSNPLQSNDNWMGVYPNTNYIRTAQNPVLTRNEFSHEPVSTQKAHRSYKNVLKYAGASLKRDTVDERLITSVENYISGLSDGYGIVTSVQDVGGYPSYRYNSVQYDSDGDGIPDEWETKHHLNPYDAGDGKNLTKSGYSNLEIYLNSLVDDIVKKQNAGRIPNIDMLKLLVQQTANKIKKH